MNRKCEKCGEKEAAWHERYPVDRWLCLACAQEHIQDDLPLYRELYQNQPEAMKYLQTRPPSSKQSLQEKIGLWLMKN
jgi:hypothetical protein